MKKKKKSTGKKYGGKVKGEKYGKKVREKSTGKSTRENPDMRRTYFRKNGGKPQLPVGHARTRSNPFGVTVTSHRDFQSGPVTSLLVAHSHAITSVTSEQGPVTSIPVDPPHGSTSNMIL